MSDIQPLPFLIVLGVAMPAQRGSSRSQVGCDAANPCGYIPILTDVYI